MSSEATIKNGLLASVNPPRFSNKNIADSREDINWKDFGQNKTEIINSIYQQNVSMMYNYGCQLISDHELVKDCIQEVFLQLVKCQPKVKSIISVKAYLFKSLQREIVRKYKKQNRFILEVPFKEHQSMAITLSPETKLIEEQFNQDQLNLLRDTLKKLSPKQQKALLLYYYEGFSYEEVAHIMNMKLVKSARKLIYKAIASLKTILKNDYIDFIFPFLLLSSLLIF